MEVNDTIQIGDKIFTTQQIMQLIDLVNELLEMNETLNAQQIALVAKLENEEKKVKRLVAELYFLQQHKNNYTA